MHHLAIALITVFALAAAPGCNCGGNTTDIGTFEGLFDGVADGYNFPFDIGIVSADPGVAGGTEAGDILAANYGTSEILLAADPSGTSGGNAAAPFFAGPGAGLMGATAISIPPDGTVWATFEQGGDGNSGGIAVIAPDGAELAVLDGVAGPGAFANPGGICFGFSDLGRVFFFMVNLGDGTVWRISAASTAGDDPDFTRVGSGLSAGTPGNPGTPGNGLTSSSDLPSDGARGCAYSAGNLYVADSANARVVRFDDADVDSDIAPVALEDTPSNLVTYPTDLSVNDDGSLIVISYDNAQAFVALDLPGGGFLDNGVHDLSVNAGNYGVAVAFDTIWFTRANNSNGTLRALTRDMDTLPSTEGPFPAQ